jgi:hypothetical protein
LICQAVSVVGVEDAQPHGMCCAQDTEAVHSSRMSFDAEARSRGGSRTAEVLTPEERKRNASRAARARYAGMTAEERKEAARNAALARWGTDRQAS